MQNMLQSGSQWLADQLNKHTTQCVIYSRGAVTLEIAATRGSSTFESEDTDGAIHRVETQDFLISDLARFREMFGDPKDGDQVHDGQMNFRVLSPGGEKPYRYSGQHRTVLRVHSKQL